MMTALDHRERALEAAAWAAAETDPELKAYWTLAAETYAACAARAEDREREEERASPSAYPGSRARTTTFSSSTSASSVPPTEARMPCR